MQAGEIATSGGDLNSDCDFQDANDYQSCLTLAQPWLDPPDLDLEWLQKSGASTTRKGTPPFAATTVCARAEGNCGSHHIWIISKTPGLVKHHFHSLGLHINRHSSNHTTDTDRRHDVARYLSSRAVPWVIRE